MSLISERYGDIVMSTQERNQYQIFIAGICNINTPDEFYRLGEVFFNLEVDLNRTPTPLEIVKALGCWG